MDLRKRVMQVILRAKKSLNMERFIPNVQRGLLFALLSSMVILLVSRLFVFPYYMHVAIILGMFTFIIVLFIGWWKRVHVTEAMQALDGYFPHNELITALTMKDKGNPLVQCLLKKVDREKEVAFEQFLHRPKKIWLPKVMLGVALAAIVVTVLFIFPAATQHAAKVVEQEKAIIHDMKKEVKGLEKKAKTKEMKKELADLQKKLEDAKTSETALREIVKKQKELKLQEQKLKEKQLVEESKGEGNSLTAKEQEQLNELANMNTSLANQSVSTQSALSKLGKPVSFALQNAIASEIASQNSESNGQGKAGTLGEGNKENSSQAQGESGKSSDSSGATQGNGTSSSGTNQGSNANGQGNGAGAGKGNGNGQGNGAGAGKGNGNGQGQGAGGGSGAGLGSGNRELSVPTRIGGNGKSTVDSGSLGEGKPVTEQKESVPLTKGTVRPYEEVIGQYKDSYLQSTERLQLPMDLQQMVQSYFSSID